MSGYTCPHCGGRVDIFPPVPEERAIWTMGVASLGHVPLDPTVSQGGDQGRPVLIDNARSAQAAALRGIAQRMVERLDGTGGSP